MLTSAIDSSFAIGRLLRAAGRMARGARLGVLALGLVALAPLPHAGAQPVVITADAQPGANGPEIQEQINAAMEDAFENLPFDMESMGGGGSDGFLGAVTAAPIQAADIARYCKILAFSSDQITAANLIFKQRTENYGVKAKAMREEIRKMMKEVMSNIKEVTEGGGAAAIAMPSKEQIEKQEKIEEDLAKERESLQTGVMEDLKGLVTKEQEPKWPLVERARRIDQALRSEQQMMTPGYRVHIRQLFETFAEKRSKASSPLDAKVIAEVTTVIDDYEGGLDASASSILALDEKMRGDAKAMQGKMKENAGKPETMPDMKAMFKTMKEVAEAGGKVRNAHQRAANAIESALPEDARESWKDTFQRASFPTIYRTTHGERVAAAALALTDLTDEQRTTIAPLLEEHVRKLADLRPKAAASQAEQHEKMMKAMGDEGGPGAAMGLSMMDPESPRNVMKAADNALVKKIRAALTEEQRAKLPKRPQSANPFAEMMGG